MYPISNALKQAFESNAKQYARITVGSTVIGNSRIRLGSFSVNRYALAEDTVVFGSCVAAEFNVTLENGDGTYTSGAFLDQEAYVEVGCDLSGTVNYVPLGYFTFDMVTVQKSALKLSSLDRMMKFEKTVNPTPYTVSGTVDSLIDSVCTACGVARGTFTLPVNGTLALSGELTDVKTYRDILRWIGEVTGTIAYIGYDGKLYFGWYSGTEDFSVDPTNRMQGSISDDATTIESVSIVQGEDMVTAGSGAKIVIRDNPLIPLATGTTAQAIANALLTHVDGFTYRTFEAGVFPIPHIAPLDCGVFSDLDGNDYSVCCTDWTFTLNANTKIAGKGGKQAYGRGYTLDESVFTARNIAARAVTAEKINVQDLAALNATIGGFSIGSDRIVHYYKDSDNNEYYLRIMSPIYGASTQGIEVLVKPNGGSWDNAFAVTYSGWMLSKNCDIEGVVKATSGLIGNISISNGAIESQNGNFKVTAAGNLEAVNGRFSGRIESTEGAIGGFNLANNKIYKRSGATPAEAQYHNGVEILSDYEPSIAIGGRTGGLTPQGETEVVQILQNRFGISVERGYDDGGDAGGAFVSENITQITGDYISIDDGNKESLISPSSLVIADRDILRTHQSLVGGWGTAIPANANLNSLTYLSVGKYYVGSSATAQTLTNCPATMAFFMDVCAPIQSTLDVESTATWVYRIQRITMYNGAQYVRHAYSQGTAGTFTFGDWRAVVDTGVDTYRVLLPHNYAGFATVLPSNIDLNNRTYCALGDYLATTAVAQTLTNCPVASEFKMRVYTPTGTTYYDETGTWKYRIRELQRYDGMTFEQYCFTEGTAGSWSFRAWKLIRGTMGGTWSTVTQAPSVTFDQAQCYVKQVDSTVYVHLQITNGIPTNTSESYVAQIGNVPLPSGTSVYLRGCAMTGTAYYYAYNTAQAILEPDGKIFLRKNPSNAGHPAAIIDFVYPAY